MKNPQVKEKNKRIGLILGLVGLVIVAGSISFWYFSRNDSSANYSNVIGSVLSSPTVASDTVSVSLESIQKEKLVFMDIKLDTPQLELNYDDRIIPLAEYRNGDYLPIIIVYTPKGNVVSGIRVCEPCGSFSFHIIDGMLDCDKCHTRWNLETLVGVSGGCQTFPPPKLPTSLNDTVTINLGSTKLKFA